ncbi:TPR repeat-containing thioredoxin TTL1 [Striga hermonthica]|uniref:TPR repeat-containing thioredoxin TTL1 n=1 Tax=Striga hermonthica TaxID=68872 RepID=A0A9N7MW68_STRHE|nr:TPR repeat-containing thioredoxin TTL1 [Striga hermonthica]
MSSHSAKTMSEIAADALSDRFRNTLTVGEKDGVVSVDKPDFRELDLWSPETPLRTRSGGGLPASASAATTTATSSSSSSSGSVTDRASAVPNSHLPQRSGPNTNSHSGELSVESSPSSAIRNSRPGHTRSRSCGSHQLFFSGSGSVNSPPANVVPTGNICPSGRVLKTGMASRSTKPDVLAISISPANAAYHFNRAAALTGLRRLFEAVRAYEEAIRLEPGYVKAHHRLGSLFLSLGLVENARKHICFSGHQPDPVYFQKLQSVEKHLSRCADARRVGDWRSTLREIDAAIASGADASPQLCACRAEALLKLHQLDDAFSAMSNIPKFEPSTTHPPQRIFGMPFGAYILYVRTQVELSKGRFESALSAAEKAKEMDPHNVEISNLLNNVRLVSRARARGNDLFRSERFTEACLAYGEGLRLDPSNSVLYCNRAACWYKLGKLEKSLDDCNQALQIQPRYTKALLRRALSNSKLERWSEAVRDYEVLRRELPNDNEVAESLFHAQVALRKSRGEEVYNMKFGGEVESVSGPEQFRAAILSSGASLVFFKTGSNAQCIQISPFLDALCIRYPSVNFLKVNIEESQAIANAENVKIVPTFKIYRKGIRVKEMVCPSPEVLESSVRHYSI